MSNNSGNNNDKKQQNGQSQNSINDAIKNMKLDIKSSSKSTSQSKMENFMQGTGFKSITGTAQKQYQLVKKQFAREVFESMLKNCERIAPDRTQYIKQIRDRFRKLYAYDKLSKVLPTAGSNSHQLRLLRIQFIKKPRVCFMGYQAFNLTFSLAPHWALKTTTNSSQKQFGFNLGFSNSSSSSSTSQQLVAMERGLTIQDLNALIIIANLGNSSREVYLQMLLNNQIQEIDY